jgi:hypothetical protein
MTDCREEINHRRGWEDNHIAIEHHRERRRNIDGRNLEKDFDSHAPVRGGPVAYAPHPPNCPWVSGGVHGACPLLCMVVWLHKFRPHLREKYDGMVNPAEFLQIYSTSILAAGGDKAIMTNYFPVALTGMARSWLMNLPKGPLDSWSELCH